MVPNLYLVLSGDDTEEVAAAGESGIASSADPLGARRGRCAGRFSSSAARGAHEVIVNAPHHVASLAELSAESFAMAVATWRERIRAHAGEAAYCHLIVNEGPDMGSLARAPHAQLYALDFVPIDVAREQSASPRTTSARPAATCSRMSRPRRCAAATGWWRSTTMPCSSPRGHPALRSSCV